jgi:tetrahydromethanopterin S-methyltransferase subunit A
MHERLNHIILCGKESNGHHPGQALLSLHRHGVKYKKPGEWFIVGANGHCSSLEILDGRDEFIQNTNS